MAKNLEEVVEQLKGAVVAHGKQAKTIEKHIKEMNKADAPAMKLGRNKKSCKVAWKEWEKPYLNKPNGKEEAAREKREFYCDNGKIKLRPSDDADVPLTDKQIKKQNG